MRDGFPATRPVSWAQMMLPGALDSIGRPLEGAGNGMSGFRARRVRAAEPCAEFRPASLHRSR
jgi:hypothetical protein